MNFLRSILFNILYVTFTLLFCSFYVLAVPLPLKKRLAIGRLYCWGQLYLAKYIAGIHWKITGLEHLQNGRGIIFCKHQSAWETFMVGCLFKDAAVVTKRELLFIPFFGWALAMTDPIAINRNKRRHAMRSIMRKGMRAIRNGRWIVFFPEGTRTQYGDTRVIYRLGCARLAIAINHAIVPVALNSGKFWPRKSFTKKPGTINIHIGPPISPKNHTPESLTEEARHWIEERVE